MENGVWSFYPKNLTQDPLAGVTMYTHLDLCSVLSCDGLKMKELSHSTQA